MHPLCVILYDVVFQNQRILDQLLKDPGIAEALTPKVSLIGCIARKYEHQHLCCGSRLIIPSWCRSKSHACLRFRFAACDLQLLNIAFARGTTSIFKNMHIHVHTRTAASLPR